MRVGVILIAATVLLAGCSSLPGNEEADVANDALPEIPLTATLGNATLAAGAPFFVELNSTLEANLTLNATWIYQVFEHAETVQENATAEGNNTEADANATAESQQNESAAPVAILEGNGTGLPGLVNLTLDAGNFSLTFTASLEGYADSSATVDLVVAAVEGAVEEVGEIIEEAEVFTCPPSVDPITATFSGTTLLPGDVGSHTIEVPACYTSLRAAVDIMVGGDMDYYLFDPSGKQRDSSAAFGAEVLGVLGEPDLVANNDDGLMVGEWTVDIENFASVATDYDLTITVS